jgi:hypothetical protein
MADETEWWTDDDVLLFLAVYMSREEVVFDLSSCLDE